MRIWRYLTCFRWIASLGTKRGSYIDLITSHTIGNVPLHLFSRIEIIPMRISAKSDLICRGWNASDWPATAMIANRTCPPRSKINACCRLSPNASQCASPDWEWSDDRRDKRLFTKIAESRPAKARQDLFVALSRQFNPQVRGHDREEPFSTASSDMASVYAATYVYLCTCDHLYLKVVRELLSILFGINHQETKFCLEPDSFPRDHTTKLPQNAAISPHSDWV